MTAAERVKLAFSPPASKSKYSTALSFTDIVFGFVITAIFFRLQNWGELQGFVRWQLIVSAVLVLGSWIGFRRSFNRKSYELKFFNLPLLRFILDQLMVLLYFRIAILTPREPTTPVDPSELASSTLETLLFVFVLYVLWDLGGLLMSWRWTRTESKYTEMTGGWTGLSITAFFLACFVGLLCLDREIDVGKTEASLLFGGATILLLAYRWAKDIRSAWNPAVETPSAPA